VITRVVVAGFGNPLRGDDGAGWRVADGIAERWRDQVTVLTGHQPVPEWSLPLSAADVAFFVDAAVLPGDRPRLRRLAARDDRPPSHTLSVEHILGLARSLYGRTPRAYMLEVPIDRTDFSECLSPLTAAAAARAVRLLDRRLARLR
jgi:hydrogenase maturation protease